MNHIENAKYLVLWLVDDDVETIGNTHLSCSGDDLDPSNERNPRQRPAKLEDMIDGSVGRTRIIACNLTGKAIERFHGLFRDRDAHCSSR